MLCKDHSSTLGSLYLFPFLSHAVLHLTSSPSISFIAIFVSPPSFSLSSSSSVFPSLSPTQDCLYPSLTARGGNSFRHSYSWIRGPPFLLLLCSPHLGQPAAPSPSYNPLPSPLYFPPPSPSSLRLGTGAVHAPSDTWCFSDPLRSLHTSCSTTCV